MIDCEYRLLASHPTIRFPSDHLLAVCVPLSGRKGSEYRPDGSSEERALPLTLRKHIMRSAPKRRRCSKLYLLNSVGMLGVYIVVVLLNFILWVVDCYCFVPG